MNVERGRLCNDQSPVEAVGRWLFNQGYVRLQTTALWGAREIVSTYEKTVTTERLLQLLAEREGEILSTEALPEDEAGC